MAKRGSTGLSFVFAVDKPAGMTSHDVVNLCRRSFGERRVGHFGTLDPLASGVLVLGVGPAARLDAYFAEHDKAYTARIVFGETRDTDDAEGTILESAPVPPEVGNEEYAGIVLAGFTGELMQAPPRYSALKQDGKTGYEVARSGGEIEFSPRPITVYEARLLSVNREPAPSWDVAFRVSKGTYIRALARDMGLATGCGAYLGALRRTELGSVTLDRCTNLEELSSGVIRRLDPVELLGYPVINADESLMKAIDNGNALPGAFAVKGPGYYSVVDNSALLAVYEYKPGAQELRCACKFSVGVSRD